MKVSIVTTVLDSHEVVRRQLLYLGEVLPNYAEWVLVDDGSNPPICVGNADIVLHRTNNFQPWTERKARMRGFEIARSSRVICVDIDHIITRALVSFVAETDYDFIKFRRRFGVLDEKGELDVSAGAVIGYGVSEDRIRRRGTRTTPPGNCYAISSRLFWKLQNTSDSSRRLKHRVSRLARVGEISICPTNERPLIYVMPNGRHCGDVDSNPYGLFHNQSRRTVEYKNAEKVLI